MKLLYPILLIVLGQTLIWIQSNAQFFSTWAKDHPFIMACTFSIPISYIFINTTALVVEYFNGLFWPGRILGFSVGMITFFILTVVFKNEIPDIKTGVCILLAFAIVLLQVFSK
jgi:hypothetical protein